MLDHLKPRRNGDYSARLIPKNAPSWAVVTPAGQSSSNLDTSNSSSTELDISSTESESTPVCEPEHSSEDITNKTNIDGRDGNLSASTDEDEDTSESDAEMDARLETATGLRV